MAETSPRVVKSLDRLGSVLQEMGRVYRAVRKGSLDPKLGRTLISMLAAMRPFIENGELERRVEALEAETRVSPLHRRVA